MRVRVGIQTERGRFLRLIDLHEQSRGTIDLTTVTDFQKRVILKLFYIDEGDAGPLDSIPVDIHGRHKAGVPRIRVQAMYDGGKTLRVTAAMNGKILVEKDLAVRQPVILYQIRWIHILGAAVVCGCILFFAILGTSRRIKTGDQRIDTTGSFKTFARGYPAAAMTSGPAAENGAKEPLPISPFIKKETVYFKSSSATLTPRAAETLLALVDIINQNPERRVIIAGHCALSGTEKGRDKISRLRARRVHEFLKRNGMLPSIQLEVRGMGSDLTVTKDPKRQNLNRRVEVVIESGT